MALIALLGVGAYLIGSTPTAYIVVRRLKNLDIRNLGSKNVGALNTFHQAGIRGAMVVLGADAAKGILAVLVPRWLGAPEWAVYITTIAVVAGHNWPVFLKFRGGKGAATILGISLVIVPWLTLVALAPTVLLVALTRNVIIGVGTGLVVVNALAIAGNLSVGLTALCLALSLLVTGTYVVAAWGQISTAIKTRRFKGLFYGTNFNP
jgi:glycerol-3-phosphate acyltransferase PlsY